MYLPTVLRDPRQPPAYANAPPLKTLFDQHFDSGVHAPMAPHPNSLPTGGVLHVTSSGVKHHSVARRHDFGNAEQWFIYFAHLGHDLSGEAVLGDADKFSFSSILYSDAISHLVFHAPLKCGALHELDVLQRVLSNHRLRSS